MENSEKLTKRNCRFKQGDIVTIPAEGDKQIKYKIISCKDNPIEITEKYSRPSCICVAQRISDGTKITHQDDYFELAE